MTRGIHQELTSKGIVQSQHTAGEALLNDTAIEQTNSAVGLPANNNVIYVHDNDLPNETYFTTSDNTDHEEPDQNSPEDDTDNSSTNQLTTEHEGTTDNEQQHTNIEESIAKSTYAGRAHAPVGFDRVAIHFRFQPGEYKLLNEKALDRQLKRGLHIELNWKGGYGLNISFNATTFRKKTNYLPLSILEYYANLRALETLIKRRVLPVFTLERCTISYLEIFKTMKLSQRPTDYAKCLDMLEAKGAYKKNYEWQLNGVGTFAVKNGIDEMMFYDKHSEWVGKVDKKKDLLEAIPDGMMRMEWRIRKSAGLQSRLGFNSLLNLIEDYDAVAAEYCQQYANLLPEIKRPPVDRVVMTSGGIEELFKYCLKRSNNQRYVQIAIKTILYYLLDYFGCLKIFSQAKKGSPAVQQRFSQEIGLYASQLPFNKKLRWIDLYNELRAALLNNDEIVESVQSSATTHFDNCHTIEKESI